MGTLLSTLIEYIKGIDCPVLVVGLDAAGKTTMLNQLQNRGNESTIPTVGFQQGTADIHGIKFNFYDIGGQEQFRSQWQYYLDNTKVIIFVVDSHDRERFAEAKKALVDLVSSPGVEKDAIIAILANKQDLPQAANANEIESMFSGELKHYRYKAFQTILTMGSGLDEAFKWIKECRASR